ncbi:hypothetical protein J6590_071577 [Homalodisca vitripennis]|nr:hypothetical protein J6590_071577 [Homalodisca vitripennis]
MVFMYILTIELLNKPTLSWAISPEIVFTYQSRNCIRLSVQTLKSPTSPNTVFGYQFRHSFSYQPGAPATTAQCSGYKSSHKIIKASNVYRGCCLDGWPLSDHVLASSPPA